MVAPRSLNEPVGIMLSSFASALPPSIATGISGRHRLPERHGSIGRDRRRPPVTPDPGIGRDRSSTGRSARRHARQAAPGNRTAPGRTVRRGPGGAAGADQQLLAHAPRLPTS